MHVRTLHTLHHPTAIGFLVPGGCLPASCDSTVILAESSQVGHGAGVDTRVEQQSFSMRVWIFGVSIGMWNGIQPRPAGQGAMSTIHTSQLHDLTTYLKA